MTAFELDVDSIGIDLDLPDRMPEWPMQRRAMEEVTALSLDYREFAPRSIILRAREAEEALNAEYGEHDGD